MFQLFHGCNLFQVIAALLFTVVSTSTWRLGNHNGSEDHTSWMWNILRLRLSTTTSCRQHYAFGLAVGCIHVAASGLAVWCNAVAASVLAVAVSGLAVSASGLAVAVAVSGLASCQTDVAASNTSTAKCSGASADNGTSSGWVRASERHLERLHQVTSRAFTTGALTTDLTSRWRCLTSLLLCIYSFIHSSFQRNQTDRCSIGGCGGGGSGASTIRGDIRLDGCLLRHVHCDAGRSGQDPSRQPRRGLRFAGQLLQNGPLSRLQSTVGGDHGSVEKNAGGRCKSGPRQPRLTPVRRR